jgi:predicted permease
MNDFKLAIRSLLKTRGFAMTALLTLGLGIGANAVVFSLVNALLLRPLPFGEATERIVTLHSTHPTQFPEGWDDAGVSYADMSDVRRDAASFEDVALHFEKDFTLYGEEAVRVLGGVVTPNLFGLLDVRPALGRDFRSDEGARAGFEKVVILSEGLWRTRFGADSNIVGEPIRINERELVVIGIMPEGFRFPERSDLWVPHDPGEGTDRSARYFLGVAKLETGTTVDEARLELGSITERLARLYPETNRGWGIHVLPYRELIVEPPVRLLAGSLLGAVGLVLLIGCANLASLLLARGAARKRELSVRTALGAGRAALVRQLLAESVLLGVLGGALGALFALWGIDALVASFPEELPFWVHVTIDVRVVAFISGISILASLLFGLVPAFRVTKVDLLSALGSGRDARAGRSESGAQGFLVVGQIAASLALLVGAGLMFQSFHALTKADPGFDDRPLLTFRVYLSGDAYDPVTAKVAFFQEAVRRIESLSGVRRATATLSIPTDDGGSSSRIVTREDPLVDGSETGVQVVGITEHFFETLDVRLVEGRAFEGSDLEESAAPVAIVNRRLAERLWPREPSTGRELGLVRGTDVEWLRIIGVAPDVQFEEFGEETAQSELTVYLPYSLLPARGMALLVRAESDPAHLAAPVRETLRAFAPGIPFYSFRTMEEVRYFTTWQQRLFSRIFGAFAVAAVFLACLGTYGLVAYRVSQRTREIGVRIALGATGRDVLRRLVSEGALLAAIGLAAGGVAALAVSRLLAGLLYRIAAVNPLLYAVAAAVLATSVLLASYVPARRAAAIDPMSALRQE